MLEQRLETSKYFVKKKSSVKFNFILMWDLHAPQLPSKLCLY